MLSSEGNEIVMDELKRYIHYIPSRLRDEVLRLGEGKEVEEIRLRRDLPLSLTVKGDNLRGTGCMTGEEAQNVLYALCGGSLHAHEKTLREGYIPLTEGARAAVVGVASADHGQIEAVREITAISIRIPRYVKGNADAILAEAERTHFSRGILIYSLPGEGKTTVLREAAIRLSSPPYLKRVALIDSKMELYRPHAFRGCLCDVLRGYPVPSGIALAVRTLSPQILVCDEIGTDEQADAILSAHPSGVPLIATVHASASTDLLCRPSIARLFQGGVFGALFRLSRQGSAVYLTKETISLGGVRR